MSELQIGAFALGVALIIGVLAYNKWQEIKQRKVAEDMFPSARADSAADADADADADVLFLRRNPRAAFVAPDAENTAQERQEPHFFAPPAPEAEYGGDEDDGIPVADNAPDGLDEDGEEDAGGNGESAAAPDEPPRDLLWSGIDAIASLRLVESARAEEMLAFLQDMPPRTQKLLRWVGLNEAQGKWELLTPESRAPYRRLCLGLQLTDRESGPVGAAEFALFARVVRQAAKAHMVEAGPLPDRQEVLDQAQQLERFCYEYDIQIGLNLASRGSPFPGTKIRALAEAAGMTLENGAYVRRDEKTGATLFCLQNAEGPAFSADALKVMRSGGLIFLLDVPVTPYGQYVYRQMTDIAKRFAATLEGALIDDRRQPLSDVQLEQIFQNYVVTPQKRMEEAGLRPGGALARRLFR
ncbi:MAG: cell division protein ZipA C-terminal FtsZ-binding domain-containing protein [Zoogloeaceae bacterium]|jgi:hypothetical protein|nr:cell division protein ZipA C-terminal FtsZ-binding domain-containing protein [Zoogloeaceae bacterium]